MERWLYRISAVCFAIFSLSCLITSCYLSFLPMNGGMDPQWPQEPGCQVWATFILPEAVVCSGFAGADIASAAMSLPIALSVWTVAVPIMAALGAMDFGGSTPLIRAVIILSFLYLTLTLIYLPWAVVRNIQQPQR